MRPETSDPHPERTNAQYCIWDEPHHDYVYTDAWIIRLTTELSDPEKFEEVIQHAPVALPNIQKNLAPAAGHGPADVAVAA